MFSLPPKSALKEATSNLFNRNDYFINNNEKKLFVSISWYYKFYSIHFYCFIYEFSAYLYRRGGVYSKPKSVALKKANSNISSRLNKKVF